MSTILENCIFCNTNLIKGSEEHVFPNALGGNIITTHATCQSCNNSFSEARNGAVEVALADNFIYIRNALNIWSGRGKPPPTIKEAGEFDDAVKYDLAPRMIPLVSKQRIPSKEETNNKKNIGVIAQDKNDAQRILNILEKRGLRAESIDAKYITTKLPTIKAEIKFEGNKIFRAIAKIAVASYVVLYGNSRAISDISLKLRTSIHTGTPEIANYCGWDYSNDFPEIVDTHPHKNSPSAVESGFEHKVFITNVNHHLVAYVSLFGGFNYSVHLGYQKDILPKCLAINPTAVKSSRFNVTFTPPQNYIPKNLDSFKNENKFIREKVQLITSRIIEHCQTLSMEDYIQNLSHELMISVQTANDESEIETIIKKFCEKVAHIESGLPWEEGIDLD